MEKKVLNWLTQTSFYKKNSSKIMLKSQFRVGEYIRQIDRTYNHPNYVVDFFIVYNDENGYEHKLIIEYDGFEEHFRGLAEVNEFNYEQYYSEDDIYRQKVLESYGYKFIRINKFNIGKNPIATLDARIDELVRWRQAEKNINTAIKETIEYIVKGQKKECPKCGVIKDILEFKDESLKKSYGRVCRTCKGLGVSRSGISSSKHKSNVNCQRCGAPMIVRSGQYGKFYGCSRFPQCRATRSFITH